jgi:hypothetical protein
VTAVSPILVDVAVDDAKIVRVLPRRVVNAIHGLFPALDTYVLSALPADTRAGTFAAFSGLSIAVEATGSGAVGALVEAGYPFTAVFRGFGVGLAAVLALSVALYRTGRLPAVDRRTNATDA